MDSWVHEFPPALQEKVWREPEHQAGAGCRDCSGQGHVDHWQMAVTLVWCWLQHHVHKARAVHLEVTRAGSSRQHSLHSRRAEGGRIQRTPPRPELFLPTLPTRGHVSPTSLHSKGPSLRSVGRWVGGWGTENLKDLTFI